MMKQSLRVVAIPIHRQSFTHRIGQPLPAALALSMLGSKSGSPDKRTSQNTWRALTNSAFKNPKIDLIRPEMI
jgi:hypothetical protein